MSPDVTLYVAAVLVVATLVAMASGKFDPVLSLMVALIVAGILGIAPPDRLLAGLSNAGVVTVAAMLVIARGIVQTGIVSRVTWGLLAATESAQQALRRLLLPVGIASSLMNTTPIVALLISATRELEQTRRIPARSVLLPIAHVTTLAGSATLIGTSSNLVIAGIASQAGVQMGMLSYAPVALPVALVGWLVIYLAAPLMLRGAGTQETALKEWRVEIPVSPSALARNRLASELGIAETQEYTLSGIQRSGEMVSPRMAIEGSDVLVFAAAEAGIGSLWRSPLFGTPPKRLFAVTINADSGETVDDLGDDGSLRVIAARTEEPLGRTTLRAGDTCYVAAHSADSVARHESVALWQDAGSRAPQPAKTGIALSILAAVIVAGSFGLTPTELAASGGAVLMVLSGVLTPGSAARALDMRVLFLIAGSIGLGEIVVSSGLAEVIAREIRAVSGGNALLVVVVLGVATALLTNFVTNAATASILTPIAIGIAVDLGVNPATVLALIGTCVSFTLINPYSHQTNLMIMHPGGYSTRSFALFGIPILAASLVAACIVTYVLLAR
jgi:di/tricarboxylate transporter